MIETTKPRKSTRRRGRGEGSVHLCREQRANGTFLEYWRGHATIGGRRKYVYGKNKAEVLANLKTVALEDAKGINVFAASTTRTVDAWLGHYVDNVMRPRWRASTYRRASELRRLHITPRIGPLVLGDLRGANVQEMLANMERDGCGVRTRQQAVKLLSQALRAALEYELVTRNACQFVKPPKGEEHTIRPLDAEQARRFVQCASMSDEPFASLYILALATGMRQGELLGLRWEDVDLKDRTLKVRRTLSHAKGEIVVSEPKTKASRRTIILSAEAAGALRTQQQRLLAYGLRSVPWVFVNLHGRRKGEPLTKEQVQRGPFERLLDLAQCAKVRFHDLRHSAATLMLSSGVPTKTVSEMLGHSGVGITLSVYAHSLPGMHEEAADCLGALLSGEGRVKVG